MLELPKDYLFFDLLFSSLILLSATNLIEATNMNWLIDFDQNMNLKNNIKVIFLKVESKRLQSV